MAINTTRMAPVAIVLPSRATATFPSASRSAMMPEPTTVATSSQVPRHSATARRGRSNVVMASGRLREAPPDFLQAPLQRQAVERAERQAGEHADPVGQHAVGVGEGQMPLGLAALGGGRV